MLDGAVNPGTGRMLSRLLGVAATARQWRARWRMATAAALVLVATGGAWLWPGPGSPGVLLPLLPPVLLAGVVFDRGTGLAAAALAALAAYALLHAPAGGPVEGDGSVAVLFLAVALAGAWLVERLHTLGLDLAAAEARLLLAQEAAGIGVYERDLVRGVARWSPAMFRVWGLDPEGRSPLVTDAEYADLVLPEDQVAHRARRAAMRDDPGASRFAAEYRIRRADTGEVRWISSRGEYVRDASGRAVLVRGTNHDVTERKVAEERQALLMREVDHRAKNALAVVQAVLRLTPRDDAKAYARAVEGRISALARAQTLLTRGRWSGAELRALLEGELAPFRGSSQRVVLDGPAVMLPPGAAQPLAMAAHELATNALKHGALSVPAGSVVVTWQVEGDAAASGVLRLRWTETGGPAVVGPPRRRGFGTRVLDSTVRSQLGGAVELVWEAAGLVCEMVVPLGRATGGAAPGGAVPDQAGDAAATGLAGFSTSPPRIASHELPPARPVLSSRPGR